MSEAGPEFDAMERIREEEECLRANLASIGKSADAIIDEARRKAGEMVEAARRELAVAEKEAEDLVHAPPPIVDETTLVPNVSDESLENLAEQFFSLLVGSDINREGL